MSEIVFKGYTAQQLDDQYNARAAVPGYEAIFYEWKTRSEDYRRRSKCELDVPYGAGADERMDLFLPDRADAPVHVFIHGGYWRAMDKSDFSFPAEGLVNRGALVAVVNYGLCPAVTMDDITHQMRTACQWLFRNCGAYKGDPGSINVSGHSAGGQQAAMLMATDWPSFSPDLPADLIKSGVPVSGLFDLEPMRHLPLNEDLMLDEHSTHRNSPIFLNPVTEAPLTIVVGGDESEEFHRQSTHFNKTWRERGARTRYLELPGRNHFTVIDQMKNQDDPLTSIMLEHMGLGSQQPDI